ncbi:MAG: tetratricopeptide repeat protein [Candidatus Doudnabacteria bacterium]|nr:tetratricopeptide repeat protein [Candidatus Doudnabacteria bacterium]
MEIVELSMREFLLYHRFTQITRFTLCIIFMLSVEITVGQKQRTPAELYALGERAVQNQSYRTALAHFNECLRIDPYFWDAYSLRGFAKEKLGDSKGAITDYNIYLEAKPQDAEAILTRGLLRYNNGQWAAAKDDFRKLLSLPAGETNTVFFQTDKSGQANKVFSTQSNSKAIYLNYLGLIEWKLKLYKQGIAYLDSAIQLEKSTPDYYVNRGLIRQSSKDTLGALADYKQALALDDSNPTATHNVAVLSGFQGNLTESEKQLTDAIAKNPKLPYSYSERGYVRLKLKNWKGAMDDFTQAILLESDEPDNYLQRGIAKEKLKDSQGALADYTHATRVKSDYERAWLNRGNLLTKLNRHAEAIEDYTIAISLYPEYALAYYNRALTYHKLGKTKEACDDLKQAQKLKMKIDAKVMTSICK